MENLYEKILHRSIGKRAIVTVFLGFDHDLKKIIIQYGYEGTDLDCDIQIPIEIFDDWMESNIDELPLFDNHTCEGTEKATDWDAVYNITTTKEQVQAFLNDYLNVS